jgi:predicted transcriptional regulator of viral defense system
MTRSSRKASSRLFSTALAQGGYFTAKQALEAGYNYPHLEYHTRQGNFTRIGHGLYRYPSLPLTEHDDLIRLALWSRDRNEESQAVASHETALVVHELSELLPSRLHLTVPPGFRKRPPPGCVLHRAGLLPGDVEERQGFRLTTPFRTLLDVARGAISQEQLDKAVTGALTRGLVRKSNLWTALREDPGLRRLGMTEELRGERAR